ncbi:MAG TPA: dockerin type I domain-containing protein [Fimbriimonadaceae bacterium]|nr:dockerin type I domain-containing protein [Fimbriimonadaceae bacterium]HRJ97612.1 dockerin type I domain-containing protein [Fimbriimonadaceae bacterium]
MFRLLICSTLLAASLAAKGQAVPVDLAGRYLAPGTGQQARASTSGADRVGEPTGVLEGTFTPFSDALKPPRLLAVSLAGAGWLSEIRLSGAWDAGEEARIGSMAGSAAVIVERSGTGFRFVDPDDGSAFFADTGGAARFLLESAVDAVGLKSLRVTALDGANAGSFGVSASNSGGPSGATAGFEVSLSSTVPSLADLQVLRFEVGRPGNSLFLHCDDPYVRPGETIDYRLGMANLAQPIGGFQAFLAEVDPFALQNYVTGLYTPTPFPTARFWGDPIPASLFLAGGIPFGGSLVQADARLANLYFVAAPGSGPVGLMIRPDNGGGFETLFADDLGTAYYPARHASNVVLIDPDQPLIDDLTATQEDEDVLDHGIAAGPIRIAFRTEDLLSGLGPRPRVLLDFAPPGPGSEDISRDARFDAVTGLFFVEAEVELSVADKPGTLYVDAEDDAGNVTSWSASFNPGLIVEGEVLLEDFLGDPSEWQVSIGVRTPGSPVPVFERDVPLDANGRYRTRFPVAPGTYDLAAKASHWLRSTRTNISLSYPATVAVDFSLVNGDCSDDNEIDIGDFAILSAHFGAVLGEPGYNRQADLNGDEEIDIGDFAILSANFGQTGDE